jgi:hypothetical protein
LARVLLSKFAEVPMPLSAHCPVKGTYRVEISGWDSAKSYFVEKSELLWNEEDGKQVFLNHELRGGAIIFVRLLQSVSPERSSSVAYRSEFLSDEPKNQFRYRLHRVHNRNLEGESEVGTTRVMAENAA